MTAATFELRNSAQCAGQRVESSYSEPTRTATLQPSAALAYSSTYTATRPRRQHRRQGQRRQCAGRRITLVVHHGRPAASTADHRAGRSDSRDLVDGESVQPGTTPRFCAPKG